MHNLIFGFLWYMLSQNSVTKISKGMDRSRRWGIYNPLSPLNPNPKLAPPSVIN